MNNESEQGKHLKQICTFEKRHSFSLFCVWKVLLLIHKNIDILRRWKINLSKNCGNSLIFHVIVKIQWWLYQTGEVFSCCLWKCQGGKWTKDQTDQSNTIHFVSVLVYTFATTSKGWRRLINFLQDMFHFILSLSPHLICLTSLIIQFALTPPNNLF